LNAAVHHHRAKLLLSCVLMLGAATFVGGCSASECDLACEREVEEVSACLDPWGMTWPDLDYVDQTEALEVCKQRYDDAIDEQRSRRGNGDVDAIRQACTTLVDSLDAAQDCSEVSEASARE